MCANFFLVIKQSGLTDPSKTELTQNSFSWKSSQHAWLFWLKNYLKIKNNHFMKRINTCLSLLNTILVYFLILNKLEKYYPVRLFGPVCLFIFWKVSTLCNYIAYALIRNTRVSVCWFKNLGSFKFFLVKLITQNKRTWILL